MNKKVFSFIPYYYSPHLETDVELIHEHVSAGDDVTVFTCSGELPACDANVVHDPIVCRHCVVKRRNAFNLVDLADKIRLKNFVNLNKIDLAILERFRGIYVGTLDELLSIKLENYSIGKTIYNEMVSLKHDTNPNLVETADYVTKSIESCALIYLSFKNHFAEEKPDIFYTFNGRFVVSQPAVAAAQATGIPFAVHDRGWMMNRYSLVHNQSFLSINHWKKEIQSIWEKSSHDLAEREVIACQWFEERFRNQKQGWFSFTENQYQNLPETFNPQKTNIIIFNSSEWEFAGMDEFELPFYETQDQGLLRIAQDLQNNHDIQIYLRVHPHLAGKQNAQTTFISEKLTGQFPNFEVIPADSPVKTYELISNADLVISFGSTTGIEAAYKRIPGVLLGRCLYEDMQINITVRSHEELIDLICNQKYKISAAELDERRLNALRYGYFAQMQGIPYKLFEQTDIYEIKFRGETVSNQAPTYEIGLKRELAQRSELRETADLNPLKAVVLELEEIADKYAEENASLKAQLSEIQTKNNIAASDSSQNTAPQGNRYVHRMSQLKQSLGKKFRNFLKP